MKKILLVDDEPTFLESMMNSIEGNYLVKTAKSGACALKMMEQEDYDLIVSDYYMKPVNGLELLEQLREKQNFIPFIMITGYGTFEVAVEALEFGAWTILPKPVKLRQLQAAVTEALEGEIARFPRNLLEDREVMEIQRMELERLRNMLTMSCDRFRIVFDHITDSVIMLDQELKIIDANRAAQEQLGFGFMEEDEFSVGENAPSRKALEQEQEVDEKIYDPIRKKFFHIFAYPILDDETMEVISIVEIRRDITREAQKEKMFLQAEERRSKIDLAAEVGHELNNMFTFFKMQIDLLDFYVKERNMDKVEVSVEKLSKQVDKLTIYSNRLMNQHMEGKDVIEIDIIDFLESFLSFIKPRDVFSPIQFRTSWEAQSIIIKADEIQLQEILLNLLKNAAEAIKQGIITISVGLAHSAKEVEITIADRGPGIPSEILDQIFSQKVSTKNDGHGFGLMIVKKLVEQNNGAITVSSQVGAGTIFKLRLPLIAINNTPVKA